MRPGQAHHRRLGPGRAFRASGNVATKFRLRMLAQQLVNGIVSGATYALFALGFTLMFGVLNVINLTYGVYFSAGALLALFATRALRRFHPGSRCRCAAIAAGLIAVVIDGLLLTPLRRKKAPELASLMVTLGATLLLYSAMTAFIGTDIRRFPPDVHRCLGASRSAASASAAARS